MKVKVTYGHLNRALDDVQEYFTKGWNGRDYSERCVIARAISETVSADCYVAVHHTTICVGNKKYKTSELSKKIIHCFDELETALRQGYADPPRDIERLLPTTLELEEIP